MPTVNEIRAHFIHYFEKNGHNPVSSSPLIPHNDPTLMFTNAGMVQFKNALTGLEKLSYDRAVTAQKCVRAGGKHNDLDNVGYTARHHTFFEMLGNFSFGDYFKDQAIKFAWDLVTKEFGLSKERLLVTVYADDNEAESLWKKISGLSSNNIIQINTSDNFWAMGDTGPCGPCSEIFYDHGPSIEGGPPGSANEDGDRFVEIWNLVFMQYEQVNHDTRIDLPNPAIDTGMGLERISAILQGEHDNYNIDLFKNLIDASVKYSNTPAENEKLISHRVIADHIRSGAFLLADGVSPSNEGRGYVLRRILRRAMRHAHQMGCKEPLLHLIIPTLVSEMGDVYPELKRAESMIIDTLLHEETSFQKTLSRGLHLLEQASTKLNSGEKLDGEVAFQLYDTYGFPLDLTEDALRADGKEVDIQGFNDAMNKQKDDARANWTGSGEIGTHELWFSILDDFGATDFLGYELYSADANVQVIIKDGKRLKLAKSGEEVVVIFNQSPFYGEAGGQLGDVGYLSSVKGLDAKVTNTQVITGGLLIHTIKICSGEINLEDVVNLKVDAERRQKLRNNHSATHLLHASLRNRLGEHVTQKGSLVADDRLRFDFSHNKSISIKDLNAVESEVNAQIRTNSFVATRLMSAEKAIDSGALALFGEKYGSEVRVVSICEETNTEPYSTELCGGTHVKRIGEIGFFKIISESATAAGIRRIEAVTGQEAEHYFISQENLIRKSSSLLKVSPTELPGRIAALIDEKKQLEIDIKKAQTQIVTGGISSDNSETKAINGITYIGRIVNGVSPRDLRGLVDKIKNEIGTGIVTLISIIDEKASLTVGVSKDLEEKFSAVDLVKCAVSELGGKGGGGRFDMAQGGGPDTEKVPQALKVIEEEIRKKSKL
ncbi:MAG: alanine--tRNA ligase [Alphaproteobacteria bacterium]|nr:alanine--tRNA ligase [Alphaproteobacteria bacterium]